MPQLVKGGKHVFGWSRVGAAGRQRDARIDGSGTKEQREEIMPEKTNLLGAIVAIAYYVLVILIFVARLAGRPRLEHCLGYALFFLAVPLACLLAAAPPRQRPALYYVQVVLLLAYLAAEALLDYIFKIDFRQVRWMTIAYVTLFFAASGGMLGVAALAGKPWSVAAVILFLAMAVLAFVQRSITGM